MLFISAAGAAVAEAAVLQSLHTKIAELQHSGSKPIDVYVKPTAPLYEHRKFMQSARPHTSSKHRSSMGKS